MDRQEFEALFSRLTPEQQKILIAEYEKMLNAHNLTKKSRLKSA